MTIRFNSASFFTAMCAGVGNAEFTTERKDSYAAQQRPASTSHASGDPKNAMSSFVHRPPTSRKVGIPAEALIPAPVKTKTVFDFDIAEAAREISRLFRNVRIIYSI
jgi:hypothetical protein